MECSIVLATRNKAECLELALRSIYSQHIPFDYEVIVVDDGSTDDTAKVVKQYSERGITYQYLDNPRYRNPATARNAGYRLATGRVIVCQCDDIVYQSTDTVARLVQELHDGEFLLATVKNYEYRNGKPHKYITDYCSPQRRPVPYFFLGAVAREDLYAVGGNDEDFVEPCYDDNWFADCLMKGLKLAPRYLASIEAHHLNHPYNSNSHKNEERSKQLYLSKYKVAEKTGVWQAAGGPWPTETSGNSQAIPKCMNFFWTANALSWIRFLTVRSFCELNPDWKVVVHRANINQSNHHWDSEETQDCGVYDGKDYLHDLQLVGAEVSNWESPIQEILPHLAPAHASDLFQWDLLGTVGGFFADMDILFVKPLPYEALCNYDTVYCLSKGYMSIGFFGSTPDNPVFQAVKHSALSNYKKDKYQSTGAEAFYRLGNLPERWGAIKRPGEAALPVIKDKFARVTFHAMPDTAIYPWAWNQVANIWSKTRPLPEDCLGIHWFGGAPLSQRMNNLLTPENVDRYPCTFTKYASQLL